jgi:hypothetical protein
MKDFRLRLVRQLLIIAALTPILFAASAVRAEYLNVITLTPGFGGAGGFTGFLDGIGVTGALTFGASTFINSEPGPFIGGSTIGGTSPQHSHPGIYTPTKALSDRIGFSAAGVAAPTVGHMTITFAAPITNPVIHVANLDVSFLDFASTAGFGGLALLSGNGGVDGDGLFVGGPAIFDGIPATADLVPHTGIPPIGGARSAYGSVRILGTYSALDFDIITPLGIENATFTFSSVPEQSSIVLAGMGIACAFFARRKIVG